MKRCVAVFLALLVTVVVAWGQIQTSGVQESPLANDVISLVPDYHPSNGMKIRMFVTPYRAVRAFTQWRVHPDSTWAPVYSGLSDTAWADTTGTTDYIMKDIQTGQTDSTIYTQVLLERGGLTSPWLEGPSVTVTDTFPVLYTMYGNAVDGGTMTIAGANFKAKDPAAPALWENFEDYTGYPMASGTTMRIVDAGGPWSSYEDGVEPDSQRVKIVSGAPNLAHSARCAAVTMTQTAYPTRRSAYVGQLGGGFNNQVSYEFELMYWLDCIPDVPGYTEGWKATGDIWTQPSFGSEHEADISLSPVGPGLLTAHVRSGGDVHTEWSITWNTPGRIRFAARKTSDSVIHAISGWSGTGTSWVLADSIRDSRHFFVSMRQRYHLNPHPLGTIIPNTTPPRRFTSVQLKGWRLQTDDAFPSRSWGSRSIMYTTFYDTSSLNNVSHYFSAKGANGCQISRSPTYPSVGIPNAGAQVLGTWYKFDHQIDIGPIHVAGAGPYEGGIKLWVNGVRRVCTNSASINPGQGVEDNFWKWYCDSPEGHPLTNFMIGSGLYDCDSGYSRQFWDDIYFDWTWARIEIGDASTWAASTHREIQIPTTWNASGSGAFTVNQGSFPSGPGSPFAYVYLVDKYGTVSNGLPIRFGFTISKRDLEGGYEIVPMEE